MSAFLSDIIPILLVEFNLDWERRRSMHHDVVCIGMIR